MHNAAPINLSKKQNQTLNQAPMNQVNIIGRVGGEVELRYTAGGKAVAQLTLAVDDGWGESKKTAWIGVTIWGATAELANKAVRKGDRLGITGRLSQEEWEDKATGKKPSNTKTTISHFDTMSTPKKTEDQDKVGVANAMHHIRTWKGRPYWLKIRIDQGPKFVGKDIFLPLKTKNIDQAKVIRDLVIEALKRGGFICLRHEIINDQQMKKEA